MDKTTTGLEEAIASFDRSAISTWVTEAQAEREQLIERFPLDEWPGLPLERYALGLATSSDGFCNWIERQTPHVGSIRGGSAHKLLVFKYRNKDGWYFPDAYENEQEAWASVRAGFVELLERVAQGDYAGADAIPALSGAPALRVKASFIYFPEGLLPICSRSDLNHFLALLGLDGVSGNATLSANHRLYEHLTAVPAFAGWSPYEIERFLYSWADPRKAPRVFKIAPGEQARLWNECLEQQIICVGWDDVGDLAQFATKDEFRTAFAAAYPNPNEGHISRKANELWTLRDLEPDDIIVANKGTATIVGIGRVVEPAYQFRPERTEYRHTVAVDWFDTEPRAIDPVKKWAFDTVATIQPALYRRILGGSEPTEGVAMTVDPLFEQIRESLERKRQVVLYGPPGTGKTYVARQFAVSWLSEHLEGADDVLSDDDTFHAVEEVLVAPSDRASWWFVANPGNWKWQELFTEGSVVYDRGRLESNFDALSIGDLVFGYEASPTLRVVALAQIAGGVQNDGDAPPHPLLTPLCPVVEGPTWEAISTDETLKGSEPVRHRSQGTLFRLSEVEAYRLLDLIYPNDEPAAVLGADTLQLPAGWLTFVTFHPSYTYEDFVEGYRPTNAPGSSGLQLTLTDGVFKRVCSAARAIPDVPHVLIIDEINRGNLPKIFGELLTVIERDKRGINVVLAQSGDTFAVPDNVYIIGTMNTADRSIRLLDAALRRRFGFIEMMPRPDLLEGSAVGPLDLADFLDALNHRVRVRFGRDKQIGHSFFLEDGKPITQPETFARVMRDEVMPLLQEYVYDHYGDLVEILGTGLVDADNETLQSDVIADAEAFVAALYEEFQASKESTS